MHVNFVALHKMMSVRASIERLIGLIGSSSKAMARFVTFIALSVSTAYADVPGPDVPHDPDADSIDYECESGSDSYAELEFEPRDWSTLALGQSFNFKASAEFNCLNSSYGVGSYFKSELWCGGSLVHAWTGRDYEVEAITAPSQPQSCFIKSELRHDNTTVVHAVRYINLVFKSGEGRYAFLEDLFGYYDEAREFSSIFGEFNDYGLILSEDVSQISRVDYYAGATASLDYRRLAKDLSFLTASAPIYTASTAPFTMPSTIAWRPGLGTSYMVAKVTDLQGNSVWSPIRRNRVVQNTPPAVWLRSPAVGSTFPAPANVTVIADALDPQRIIERVDFYLGKATTPAHSAVEDPYEFPMTNLGVGTYTVWAVAVDAGGLSTRVGPLSFSVTNAAPTVALTSPLDGANGAAGSTFTISATASDETGVARVDFYDKGLILIGSDTTAPYSVTWSGAAPGVHTITAKAVDRTAPTAQTTVSAASSLYVTDSTVNLKPRVVVTAPLQGGFVKTGALMTVTASAQDFDVGGKVKQIRFFRNSETTPFATFSGLDAASATRTTAAFAAPTAIGPLTFRAQATDVVTPLSASDWSDSKVVSVNVVSNLPPSVTLTSPTAGTVLVAPSAMSFSVNASDDGSISKIEYFRDGRLLSTPAAPYNFSMPSQAGTYTFWAKATDNLGASTESAKVTITVATATGNSPPLVAIQFPRPGSALGAPANFDLVADAFAQAGIHAVEFFEGSTLLSVDQLSPYVHPLSGVSEGPHVYWARVVDNQGTVTESLRANIFVTGEAPVVSWISPVSGATGLIAPSNVAAVVDAYDTDGGVVRVSYYLDGIYRDQSTQAPGFPYTYVGLGAGDHVLKAIAFDAAGNPSAPAEVTITIAANVPPTANFTSPTTSGPFLEGKVISLDAVVHDSDELHIQTVDFINAANAPVAEGVLRLGGPTPTYTGYWTPSAGTYQIRARATDWRGGVGVSSPRQINVKLAEAPAVSMTSPGLPDNSQVAFVGDPIQLSAQVNDPDANLGGRITLVEFRRHFTAANGQPTSELIYSSTSGTSGTYSYTWTVPALAFGQTSTFSVTAKDDGPDGRNSTTVNSSLAISVLDQNHAPKNVRFHPYAVNTPQAWPSFWGPWQLLPSMPSRFGQELSGFDWVPTYKVQSNGQVLLCAFADDQDGNLSGIRFYLSRSSVPDQQLAEVTTKTASGFCAGGYKTQVSLTAAHASTDIQFIRATAFDSRNANLATQVNPDSGQVGHIPCRGNAFVFGDGDQPGSPCVKFSIPVAIVNPSDTTSPCGNPGSGGAICGSSRFLLPTSGITTTLEAERYDSGGQGIGMFEKDLPFAQSVRADGSRIGCNPSTFGPHCTLQGFDNGEYRRYSVTMPTEGTVDYTLRFKPPLPEVWIKSPQDNAHILIGGSGSGGFPPVSIYVDVSGYSIGDRDQSLVYVKFFKQFVGPGAQINEIERTLPSTLPYHFGSFAPTFASAWKISAQAVVTFYPPAPALPLEIEGPMSEVRTVHWVTSLSPDALVYEPAPAVPLATEKTPTDSLGAFEGRTSSPECTGSVTTLDDREERWFTERFCGVGLPANDYHFNLGSDVDGTEIDWIRFSYVSAITTDPEVEVTAPATDNRFPRGATIGLHAAFSGATASSLVRFDIWPVDTSGSPTGPIQQVHTSHNTNFQGTWLAPVTTGRYMVQAFGQLATGTPYFSSAPVRFFVEDGPANPAPQVTLTSPSSNLAWTTGTPLPLSMTATDADGINPATVRFVLTPVSGDQIVLTDNPEEPGYSVTWTPSIAGTYTLSAYARDSLDALGSWPPNGQPARTITVTESTTPTVSFFASPSTNLIAPASTELRATVTGGSNISVQFEHDTSNTVICSGVPQPGNLYTCTWDNLAAGSYGLHARALVDGQQYLSASITLVVTAPEPVSATRTYVYDQYERLCKVINPESGATFFGYDLAGNLAWTLEGSNLTGPECNRSAVENSPQRVVRVYDEMNRLKRIDYPAGTDDVRYDYELDGALKTVEVLGTGDTLRNKWTYTYNNRRMTRSETLLLDGESRAVDYAYNVNGHLESLTYPGAPGSRRTVEYAPNGLGQPKKVADAAGTPGANTYADLIDYYPNGAIHAFTYGNGIRHEMAQNDRQLPAQSLSTRQGATLIDDRYHYDDNGNVIEILDYVTPTFTRSMDYDALDRLTHVSVGANFWNSSDYTYDALDNIRTAKQGTRNFRYLYDNGNKRLTQMYDPTGSNHIDLEYNPVGDVVSKLSVIANVTKDHDYTYDAAHRLLAVPNVASYEYDGHGRRVKEIRPTQADEVGFYNQAGQKLYTKQGSTETHNIYFGGSLLAELKTGTPYELTYLHTDALGSVVAKSSIDGVITESQRYRYTPYGEDFGGTLNGLGYTGHDMDQETGLTYMQQRYYDPVVGRFLAVDPIGSGIDSGENFNSYWYGENNPFRYIDPDGRHPAEAGENAGDIGHIIGMLVVEYQHRNESDPVKKVKSARMLAVFWRDTMLHEKIAKAYDLEASVWGRKITMRDPMTIKHIQKGISSEFVDSEDLDTTINQLRNSAGADANKIPPIRVFEENGQLYTLDHRRLHAHQEAGVPIQTVMATSQEVKIEKRAKGDGLRAGLKGDRISVRESQKNRMQDKIRRRPR